MYRIKIKFLYQNTINFFINRIYNILFISILSACISTTLGTFFLPKKNEILLLYKSMKNINIINIDIMNFIKNLSLDQKNTLFRIFFANFISNIIDKTILFGTLITEIKLIQIYCCSVNITCSILSAISIFPKLFFLIFLITIFTQIGFVFFVTPGIILFILLSFSPIILIFEKPEIIRSMYIGINLSAHYLMKLIPSVSFLFVMKTITFLVFNKFNKMSFLSIILMNSTNNLFYSCSLIYLCRLYMLVKKEVHKFYKH